MGQIMPPPPPMSMGQRVMNVAFKVKDAFPKWLSQYSIVLYIIALAIISSVYSTYSMPWYYMLSG